MAEELTFTLFARLSALGVREITLTKEAADGLCERTKGLYRPDMPREDWMDLPGAIGRAVGITFYRE